MRVRQAFIRRKVRVEDPDAIMRILVPRPLPRSWGRTVRPYEPPGGPPSVPLPGPARAGQPPGSCAAAAAGESPGSDENRDLNGGAADVARDAAEVAGARCRGAPDMAGVDLRRLAPKGGFQVWIVPPGGQLPLVWYCPARR